jgi:hypothetical protein
MKFQLKIVAKNQSFVIGKVEGTEKLRIKVRNGINPERITYFQVAEVAIFLKETFNEKEYKKKMKNFFVYLKSLKVKSSILEELDSLIPPEKKYMKIIEISTRIFIFFIRIFNILSDA